jgi:hypothetical protein
MRLRSVLGLDVFFNATSVMTHDDSGIVTTDALQEIGSREEKRYLDCGLD